MNRREIIHDRKKFYYKLLASFTRPQKGGLLLTVCACAKLLDNFPVMFPLN